MGLAVGLAILAFVMWHLARPLRSPRRRAAGSPRGDGLARATGLGGAAGSADRQGRRGAAERDRLLRQLAELEYDYRMGKIERRDYEELRAELLREEG